MSSKERSASMSRQQRCQDEYSAALVDLTQALMDFRDAGGDALNVVGALQRFMHAKLDIYDAIKSGSWGLGPVSSHDTEVKS